MQLFDPVIPDSDANSHFLTVRDRWQYTPARRLMEQIFARLSGGSKRAFVQDFQTHGFAARTWELALFAYLNEHGYHVEVTSGPPDYLVRDDGMTVVIEATTSNPPRTSASIAPQAFPQSQSVESLQQELVFSSEKHSAEKCSIPLLRISTTDNFLRWPAVLWSSLSMLSMLKLAPSLVAGHLLLISMDGSTEPVTAQLVGLW